MQTLFSIPVNLNLAQVQAIVRGMYQVAQADGVHHTELVMMRDFYQLCAEEAGALASFEDVVATEFDAQAAAAVLDDEAVKQVFLASCLMLAYADGRYSAAERAKVAKLARAVGIGDQQLTEIEDQVADHLMAAFAHIENLDALKEVAEEIRRAD